MITERICNIFFALIDKLLSFVPDVSLEVPTNMMVKFFEVLRVGCYFLPMGTIVTILGIIVAEQLAKIAIALFWAVWDLIPFKMT